MGLVIFIHLLLYFLLFMCAVTCDVGREILPLKISAEKIEPSVAGVNVSFIKDAEDEDIATPPAGFRLPEEFGGLQIGTEEERDPVAAEAPRTIEHPLDDAMLEVGGQPANFSRKAVEEGHNAGEGIKSSADAPQYDQESITEHVIPEERDTAYEFSPEALREAYEHLHQLEGEDEWQIQRETPKYSKMVHQPASGVDSDPLQDIQKPDEELIRSEYTPNNDPELSVLKSEVGDLGQPLEAGPSPEDLNRADTEQLQRIADDLSNAMIEDDLKNPGMQIQQTFQQKRGTDLSLFKPLQDSLLRYKNDQGKQAALSDLLHAISPPISPFQNLQNSPHSDASSILPAFPQLSSSLLHSAFQGSPFQNPQSNQPSDVLSFPPAFPHLPSLVGSPNHGFLNDFWSKHPVFPVDSTLQFPGLQSNPIQHPSTIFPNPGLIHLEGPQTISDFLAAAFPNIHSGKPAYHLENQHSSPLFGNLNLHTPEQPIASPEVSPPATQKPQRAEASIKNPFLPSYKTYPTSEDISTPTLRSSFITNPHKRPITPALNQGSTPQAKIPTIPFSKSPAALPVMSTLPSAQPTSIASSFMKPSQPQPTSQTEKSELPSHSQAKPFPLTFGSFPTKQTAPAIIPTNISNPFEKFERPISPELKKETTFNVNVPAFSFPKLPGAQTSQSAPSLASSLMTPTASQPSPDPQPEKTELPPHYDPLHLLREIVDLSGVVADTMRTNIKPSLHLRVAGSKLHQSPHVQQHWDHYLTAHGKNYSSAEEHQRKRKWLENIIRIHHHNEQARQGLQSYFLGANPFSDMEVREYNRKKVKLTHTGKAGKKETTKFSVHKKRETTNTSIPEEWNWVEQGFITPNWDQEDCGSCYAFSIAASAEGQYFRKTKKIINLSAQQLVDCSVATGNHGCNGGSLRNTLRYCLRSHGLTSELNYPYRAKQQLCHFHPHQQQVNVSSYVILPENDEEAIKTAVATVGPVACSINASPYTFQLYHKGIYDDPHCSSRRVNHAMVIVGYTKNAWILKNWWGREWGENGYMYLRRGKNRCAVAKYAAYPIVDDVPLAETLSLL